MQPSYEDVFILPCSVLPFCELLSPCANLLSCIFQVSLGIMAINEAVDHGDVSQTLSALRSPDVGLYGVTPECAETYQQELSEVKKRAAGTP